MYLDGCFMLAQKNQDYYHDKCISLVPSNSKRILIIGGGDFAIASMLYNQKNVRVIDVVEIDEEVVNVSKNISPDILNLNRQIIKNSHL